MPNFDDTAPGRGMNNMPDPYTSDQYGNKKKPSGDEHRGELPQSKCQSSFLGAPGRPKSMNRMQLVKASRGSQGHRKSDNGLSKAERAEEAEIRDIKRRAGIQS